MESRRIIRIDSDGYANQSHVHTDDGKELERVISVYWSLDVSRGISEANIEVVGIALYARAELDYVTFICPVCDHRMEHRCHDQSLSVPERGSDESASGNKD